MAKKVKYPLGIRVARRSLGLTAYHRGNLVEAEAYFQSALESVRERGPSHVQSQLYLDFATLAYAQAKPDTAAMYLCKAYTAFQQLQIPKYVERTEQLARKYGVALTEVALDDLTEGEG